MKIALVVHDLHTRGGHSLYTRILADELSQRHEVAVFANRFEQKNGARWKSHHVRAWRKSALACVKTFPMGLRSEASNLANFQIQHSQGYCGGTPNVVTAHICVAAYLRSLNGAERRHKISLGLMASAEKRFYRGFQGHVIAVSQKVADELREFYDVDLPTTVISHGVDSRRFATDNRERNREDIRSQLGLRPDQTLALYVGDLTKAHTRLKELSEVAPDIHLGIVSYSRAYRWEQSNVHFLDPTPDLMRYYAAADAFVFPTTYDAFGMVVLEAMASGLPVFTSDRAGAAELIENGKDGFVTPLTEWTAETSVSLRDLEQLRTVGAMAAQTARKHRWSSVVYGVERIYQEVANP